VNGVVRNVGSVRNRGAELSVGITLGEADGFRWNGGFNISANRNKVMDLGDRDVIYPAREVSGGIKSNPVFIKEGEPLGVFQGYVFEGIFQKGEEEEAARYGKVPGDSEYRDVNDDGQINAEDRIMIGNATPDFTFGFNHTFSYGNFDLNLAGKGSYGGKVYNLTRARLFGFSGGLRDPVTSDVLDYWTPQNPSNSVPAFGPTQNDFLLSTKFLEDGSFLRVTNISLGYELPSDLAGRLSLERARITVGAENYITFTGYNGYDPELSSGGESDVTRSVDLTPYPTSKAITFGLDVTL
jgi:hypothetical protein